MIVVEDSARMAPALAPNNTWSTSGTKKDPSICTTCPPLVEPSAGLILAGCGGTPVVAETIAVAQHDSTAASAGIQLRLSLLGSGTDRMKAPPRSPLLLRQ